MSHLFSPLTIKGVTLKNRIVMSPMCQYSAKDGFINEWHYVHYGTRAVGGAGLIMVEATSVSPEGRITPGDLGLWSDDHVDGLRRVADFICGHGAVAGIQLGHAGRNASCAPPWEGNMELALDNGGWETVAPSAIPFNSKIDRVPEMLDKEGIKRIVEQFRESALRALEAGFRVLEIHSAHGYLLHEFLSPISNSRTDEYGGSFENRTRMTMEVVEAVRAVWPEENPLFVRVSSTEWSDQGWNITDSIRLAIMLKKAGVDLIDCSSGGNVFGAKIPVGPGYQVDFAKQIRESGIMTGAVGLITEAQQAEEILSSGRADLILLGRELLRNPYFAMRAAVELGDTPGWLPQYIRAKK